MSATAKHPLGSPLGSSTRGVSMDEHNRGRSEFEARVERLLGSKIIGFHFEATFEDRRRDLDCSPVPGRSFDEAKENAASLCHGRGLKLVEVHPAWSVAFLKDGRMLDRRSLEKLVAAEGASS